MIVVDCSAAVEVLAGSNPEPDLVELLARSDLQAPHLLDVELMNVLRGLELGGKITTADANAACTDYFSLSVTRYRLDTIAERVWDLRRNVNAYDASYLALAEALDCPLVTCDRKLATTSSQVHTAKVQVYGRTIG